MNGDANRMLQRRNFIFAHPCKSYIIGDLTGRRVLESTHDILLTSLRTRHKHENSTMQSRKVVQGKNKKEMLPVGSTSREIFIASDVARS